MASQASLGYPAVPIPHGGGGLPSAAALLKLQHSLAAGAVGLFPGQLVPHPAADPLAMLRMGLPVPAPLDAGVDPDVDDDPDAELESKELWQKFDGLGTEMVITKSGR